MCIKKPYPLLHCLEPARPAKNLSATHTMELLFPSSAPPRKTSTTQRIPTQNQQATTRWHHQERACRSLLSLHGNNNRGALQPECDLRYQRCVKNHQEPSQNKQEHHCPTKRNAVACPRNEPGLSSHWPQSGGQPAHLSLLPSTGSGKPALKHLFQESLFFSFFSIIFIELIF
jgi:hypothetical protein